MSTEHLLLFVAVVGTISILLLVFIPLFGEV